MEKRPPRNTEAEVAENPFGMLLDAMTEKDPGDAILRQEAQGQTSFVNSTTLPTDWNGRGEHKEILEKAGIAFGEVVDGDPMFQYVTLPNGWRKAPTDHSMWSDLLDEKGRKRASIFYKAAFYDRSAYIRLVCRFSVTAYYNREEAHRAAGVAYAFVEDCEKGIWRTPGVSADIEKAQAKHPNPRDNADWPFIAYMDAKMEAERLAKEYLSEHYPDWRNPGAYWDEE